MATSYLAYKNPVFFLEDRMVNWLLIAALLFYAMINSCFGGNLLCAIEENNLLLLKEIIQDNPDQAKLRDADGWTPLAYASRFGRTEIVDFLIRLKVEIDSRDNHQFTPLHQAAAFGHLDVVKLLVRSGADINSRTEGGVTPRRLADSNGHSVVAEWLSENGAFR